MMNFVIGSLLIVLLVLFPEMDGEFIRYHYFWEKGMNFRTRASPDI